MDSITIYSNLCKSRKHLKESYGPGSGLHEHHIVPSHMGGADDDSNYTYLTPREHQIAHYLLWRIYRNPNDLRAMKMLGARLTPLQRKITGEYCRDNSIGFFNPKYNDIKNEWRAKGCHTQIKNKIGIHNPDNFSKYSALGGKAGAISQIKNKVGIHTSDKQKRSEWASLGGKAHLGKRCMYKPGDSTFKRVHPESVDKYLSEGYIFGSPFKGNNQYTNKRSS